MFVDGRIWNWNNGGIAGLANQGFTGKIMFRCPIPPSRFALIVNMVENGTITKEVARGLLLAELIYWMTKK